MKRTALKRGATPLKRGKLTRGTSKLSRTTSLRKVGKRGRANRSELDRVRASVLKRARNRCERCGLPSDIVGALHLHHRLRRSQGGAHEAENLAALCHECHAKVHLGVADAHLWLVTRGGAS